MNKVQENHSQSDTDETDYEEQVAQVVEVGPSTSGSAHKANVE